jgi:hypothetical protein
MNVVCQEDGFVEYWQFFLYLFASAIFAYVGVHRGYRNVWYWGYAALFLFVAGEEVSWGQRIFDVATPTAIAQINMQKEITLHNLDGIHQHSRLLGALPCLVICFVIPLTAKLRPAMRDLYRRLNMPIYPLSATWIFPTVGFAFLTVHRLMRYLDFRQDEMAELYLGLGFLAFAIKVYMEARAHIAMQGRETPASVQLNQLAA